MTDPERGELPLVSAVIPTHNRSAMLERALRSVFAQTYPRLEIVVVDDGSTDDTQIVIERLQAERPIVYVRNPRPMGAPAARNRGIAAATGLFVAGLDDDDEWLPYRIERLVDAYDASFSCVTSDDLLVRPSRTLRWRKKRVITRRDILLSNMVGNQVLVERERILEIGGFDESLPAAQDYDVWIRLVERYGPVLSVREALQRVHIAHAGRITTSTAQYRGYLAVYAKHRDKMDRRQRAYQLYLIRRQVGKPTSLGRFFSMVPPQRWLKELSALMTARLG
jgi:glycosyltransferase involved in cell wall biosynthesis